MILIIAMTSLTITQLHLLKYLYLVKYVSALEKAMIEFYSHLGCNEHEN